MDIRPFRESDVGDIVALWRNVFGYTASHNDPAKVIRQKLAFEHNLFFVAEVDRLLVGTVMGGYDGHRGWIYSLAVRPELRHRRIGTALMEHVERELAKKGCPKVNLQVVTSNDATVAFYKQLGYLVEERVSMGKLLNSPIAD